jgi:hypothetical protein
MLRNLIRKDPYHVEKRIRSRIKVKRSIRIRIRVKIQEVWRTVEYVEGL